MIARCLVGGCDWKCSDEYVGPLMKAAEEHRAQFHDWCKPGMVHCIEADPDEAPSDPS